MDHVTGGAVDGWIWAPAIPDLRLPVRVYRNGSLVATQLARYFRPDLLAAGKGDGCYAFHVLLDCPVRPEETISVRLGSTRCEIEPNPGVAR